MDVPYRPELAAIDLVEQREGDSGESTVILPPLPARALSPEDEPVAREVAHGLGVGGEWRCPRAAQLVVPAESPRGRWSRYLIADRDGRVLEVTRLDSGIRASIVAWVKRARVEA